MDGWVIIMPLLDLHCVNNTRSKSQWSFMCQNTVELHNNNKKRSMRFAKLYLSFFIVMVGSSRRVNAKLRRNQDRGIPSKARYLNIFALEKEESCNGCNYLENPVCQECLEMEMLIVMCGDCFYTNMCFAIEVGEDPSQCQIVQFDLLK